MCVCVCVCMLVSAVHVFCEVSKCVYVLVCLYMYACVLVCACLCMKVSGHPCVCVIRCMCTRTLCTCTLTAHPTTSKISPQIRNQATWEQKVMYLYPPDVESTGDISSLVQDKLNPQVCSGTCTTFSSVLEPTCIRVSFS